MARKSDTKMFLGFMLVAGGAVAAWLLLRKKDYWKDIPQPPDTDPAYRDYIESGGPPDWDPGAYPPSPNRAPEPSGDEQGGGFPLPQAPLTFDEVWAEINRQYQNQPNF